MKNNFILIIILVLLGGGTSLAQSQIDSFIIGGLIVNPSDSYTTAFSEQWRSVYFDTLRAYGLNYAEYSIMENGTRIPNPVGGVPKSDIDALLNSMAAKGIKSRLNTYAIFDNWTKRMPYARRWMFQVEQDSGFSTTYSGSSLPVDGAESHYHLPRSGSVSARKLTVGQDIAGVVCKDVRIPTSPNFTIPDQATYHLRVRAKLDYVPLPNDNTPIIRIKVTNLADGNFIQSTVYAKELDNQFKEIRKIEFYKYDPQNPPPPDPIDKPYEYIDPHSRSGNPDYLLDINTTSTPYDIEVYWYGLRNCYLDYIAIDDSSANVLYSGGYDETVIEPTVEGFYSNPGLGSFSVWDEPFAPNYHPVGYVNSKIKKILSSTLYKDKIGMAFNVMNSWSSKKFLHETQQDMHLADIYQFHGWATRPDVLGLDGYNQYHSIIFDKPVSGVQAIYDKLFDYINEQIVASREYEKEYVVALQAHSWKIGNSIERFQYLREPSLYEMIAQANIAIGLGAHGIMWNKYSPTEEWEAIQIGDKRFKINSVGILDTVTRSDSPPFRFIPRYTDSFGLPKWEGMKAFHSYLKKIGTTLLNLDLEDSDVSLLHLQNLPAGKVISQIESGVMLYNSFEAFEASKNFVQCSFLTEKTDSGRGSNYIHIVNRRTHNSDTNIVISLTFNNGLDYKNWQVEELGTETVHYISSDSLWLLSFRPGEGKLLRVTPVTKLGYGIYKTNETINEVVTVPSGKTLNIEKGVTLNFGNAGRLVSNGTLNINGAVGDSVSLVFDSTAFAAYNTGVRINGGVATIKYAKIRNAYYGVRVLNNARVIIYGSRLYNNYAGVLFEDNLYSYTRASTIDTCRIHHNDIGVYFHNGTGRLKKNRISYNILGVLANTGSIGYMVGNDGTGKNQLVMNEEGALVQDYSHLIFGDDYYFANYNTLDQNMVDVDANNNSVIDASYVWWGDDVPNLEYQYDQTSIINFDNHLLSVPPDGISIDPIGHDHGYASEGTVSQMRDQQATDDINTRMGFDPAVTSTPVEGTNLNKLLNEARKYFRSGNYYAGAEICKAIIDSNKNDKVSVRALNLLSAESLEDHSVEFRAYIEQLNRVPGMTKIDSYVGLIDAKLDPKKYESKIDALIAKYNKKDELLMYLYDKFVHCLLNKEKPDQAIAVYAEMVQRFPESKLTQIAYRMLNPVQFSVSQNLMSTENAQLPKEYGISNNYPNPFNPETSIDYAIPYPSNVVIELYGVTGEKVRTLIQNDHTPGYYTYRLTNTSGMASGIYFYRIAATNLQNGKVYSTVRKMTLMK